MSQPERGLKALIASVAGGQTLSVAAAEEAFDIMMSGDATPAQVGGLLMALRVRGETVDEITGGALIMRAKMRKMQAPVGAIDVVGTGGDGKGTFNISTASALVVAGCGVPVAKHGNRAMSSRSGAADVLGALGVNLEADYDIVQRAIDENGMGFMLAPRYHGAMRHVGGVRVELGTRTIFNLLGPISNPAGVKRLLVGVFSRDWIEPVARVLGKLGTERAWVVHGADGCDELTTSGPSYVAALDDGTVRTLQVTPEDAGVPRAAPEAILGGDAQANAHAMNELLDGKPGPLRDVVLLNSAAALIVAGRAADLEAGARTAAQAIDSGRARDKLARLIAISQGQA